MQEDIVLHRPTKPGVGSSNLPSRALPNKRRQDGRSSFAFPKPTRPEKTRQPLRRKAWMRRQSPRRLSKAGSDPAYLAWVRTLPCLGDEVAQAICRQPIHAHHAGRRPGIAMKADDRTAIPLCELHHADWHNAGGIFRGLSKFERFAWAMRAIARTQALYRARQP